MSNQVNDRLLEETAELVDLVNDTLASGNVESTTGGKMLDLQLAQVIKHIDDNNFEDLYYISKPTLERTLAGVVEEMERDE